MEPHRKYRKGVIVRTFLCCLVLTVVAAASAGTRRVSSSRREIVIRPAAGRPLAMKYNDRRESSNLLNAIRPGGRVCPIQSAATPAGYSCGLSSPPDQDAQKQPVADPGSDWRPKCQRGEPGSAPRRPIISPPSAVWPGPPLPFLAGRPFEIADQQGRHVPINHG